MNNKLKVLEITFEILLVVIILVNIISIISIKVMKNDYPNIFGYSYFTVLSGSMEPAINIGDEVFVKITKSVSKGDVITFIEDDAIVSHRLIEVEGDRYITKGDANESSDDPIDKNVVIGKVIFVLPFFGKIKQVFTNVYFVIIFVLLFVLCEIFFSKKKSVNKS